ncbi:voltage-dependent anion channel [Lucifera butyrica]|uniref:Voltage-dependent anion channel n=1 Tax=Lucifera butyrica TaxID=1351585 RepID=A0A498RB14_9FIRM|nr:TDT family transporter [Lucifera butyrica]VBB07323.1 voltage-dependent anion channel [Lucifera butyrica]
MKEFIHKLPVPLAGLMLALAAEGNLVAVYGSSYKMIFGSLAGIILLLFIIKIVFNMPAILADFSNPVIASVAPTFSMAIIILAAYINPGLPRLAYGMWLAGIFIHGALLVYFTNRFIFHFNIRNVFPSYFIVYVGIVTVSVTAPAFNALTLGRGIFWFGFITYLALLPVVMYRVLAVKAIPEPVLPNIAIFAAPASLCLTGYLNSFPQKDMTLLWLLIILSLMMFFVVLLYMPKMLRLKFYPSYSAFTFPFVISAAAMKAADGFLFKTNQTVPALKDVAGFEEVFAGMIVIYVLLRYIRFLFFLLIPRDGTEVSKMKILS